jgi:hypothetical protein
MSEQQQRRSASTDERPTVPLEVYYIVQTTSGVIGKRPHRVQHPSLYERRSRAQLELMHLQTACPGGGTYSIWKATTYVAPAEWLYDVVVADGSLIRLGGGDPQRSANRH